jgi:predicted glycosyltransferase
MATLTYPFATAIVAPDGVRMGRWESRTLHYPSCQKLFYLHPDRFRPDPEVRGELGLAEGEPFGIVRLSALQALHDRGIRGISADFVRDLTEGMAGRGIRCLSLRKAAAARAGAVRFAIPRTDARCLGLAAFFPGGHQSMTVEAALLGTPAFRPEQLRGPHLHHQ